MTLQAQPALNSVFQDAQGITYVVTKATPPCEVQVLGGDGNPNQTVKVNNPVIPATVTDGDNTFAVTGIQDYAFAVEDMAMVGSQSASALSDGANDYEHLTGTLTIECSSIGSNAFAWCRGLTGALVIPATVTDIGDGAFAYCTGLTGLTLHNSGSIGSGAFSDCTGLTGTLIIPATVTDIGNSAFYACTGLTGLTLNNSGSIGRVAFYNCRGLTGTLDISATVTEIGNGAFTNCTGLTGLALHNSGSIGGSAFEGCTSLTSAYFSSSVVSIQNVAFTHCSSLNSLTFGKMAVDATYVKYESTFSGVAPVGTLYYPEGAAGYDILLARLPAGWSTKTTGNATAGDKAIGVRTTAGGLWVTGLVPGEILTLYDMQGRPVYDGKVSSGEQFFPLCEHGIYIIVARMRSSKVVY